MATRAGDELMFSISQSERHRVMCAHCGRVYVGQSQALTWAAAKACADSHQLNVDNPGPAATKLVPLSYGPGPGKRVGGGAKGGAGGAVCRPWAVCGACCEDP
jgi:hypothetical protein